MSCVTSHRIQAVCCAGQCIVAALLVLMDEQEREQHEMWGVYGEGSGLELRRFHFGSQFSQRLLWFLWSNRVNQLLEPSALLQKKQAALGSLWWALRLHAAQVLRQRGPTG